MRSAPKPSARSLTVLAPAKVNLFLHVTGRRADGYHRLESLFAFADIGDKISLVPASSTSFAVTGPYAEALAKAGSEAHGNLVVKALEGLRELLGGANLAAAITLEKNLPLSSGLGGGSSDAAAALKALQIVWGVEAEEGKLYELALKLGADVPACLLGEACLVSGIGDEVKPVSDFLELACVLVNPNLPLATPAVFKAFAAREFPFTPPLFWGGAGLGNIWELMARTKNDLQGSACGILPEVGKVLMALERVPGAKLARMSGSGATCFALFENADGAESAARTIAKAEPGWWVKAAILRRRPPFLLSS